MKKNMFSTDFSFAILSFFHFKRLLFPFIFVLHSSRLFSPHTVITESISKNILYMYSEPTMSWIGYTTLHKHC